MEFSEKVKKAIEEKITNYCEGINYLEFSVDDLPDMINDIEKVITDNEDAL